QYSFLRDILFVAACAGWVHPAKTKAVEPLVPHDPGVYSPAVSVSSWYSRRASIKSQVANTTGIALPANRATFKFRPAFLRLRAAIAPSADAFFKRRVATVRFLDLFFLASSAEYRSIRCAADASLGRYSTNACSATCSPCSAALSAAFSPPN